MLFSSWQFIFLFLPAALAVFFLIPPQPSWTRKVWLLAASLFFYGYWKIEYIPLLLFSIGFNYIISEIITRHRHHPAARVAIIVGVSLNLLLLGYYKYTNFILQALGRVSDHHFEHFDIILPLAISFFTFTQIGYIVDVYRNQSLHYRLLDYALFVVFFPHLIAGPIVRHWEIIPQFAERVLKANIADLSVGAALFLIGLYKKVLFADPLSPYVASVYGAAARGVTITWFDSWLGTLAFALQLYFDFSGYSDMAIGLARMFGIKFPINFASPYKAASINEFWMRWHITLTRFLREYLYFPLGGNRCGPWRHALNILITMLLSGLWHGAGWTYVIWGGLHGVYLIISHQWQRFRTWRGWEFDSRACHVFTVALTFLAVLVAWVFFRANTLSAAGSVLGGMAGSHGLTMADTVTDPVKIPGVWWTKLGVRFVSPAFEFQGYTELMKLTVVALVIAWFLPNAQQLLASYSPALEQTTPPRWVRLKLGWLTGLVFGGAFFWVVRSFYVAAPTPFLYFNF
jgi:alginate O-acetyltransferase complex protein AlgI